MKKPLFSGVCTALITPFLNDKVNYPLLKQLLRFQMDGGVKAVVLAGTTGESPTLSDKEKISMFRQAKAYAGDECIVIAGTGSNATSHAVSLSIAAQDAGADGLLVVAPYYNKGNHQGLYEHFTAVAKAVDIPIIVYNVPSRTGVDIPVSVYRKLSAIPNIIGVKEASTDISKTLRIRYECPEDFYIWCGNDDQTVPVMSLGGQGVISVLSNVFPEETVLMADAALSGDYRTAAKLQSQLLPVIDMLFCEVNPIPVKYIMEKIGFDCGPCRPPLGPLSELNRTQIDQFFQ